MLANSVAYRTEHQVFRTCLVSNAVCDVCLSTKLTASSELSQTLMLAKGLILANGCPHWTGTSVGLALPITGSLPKKRRKLVRTGKS